MYHSNTYITKQEDAKLKLLLLKIPLLPKILTNTSRLNRKSTSFRNIFIKAVFGLIYLAMITFMILNPLLIVYFIYTAVSLQSSVFLITSWLIVFVWLLAAILADEHSGFKEKLSLAFCSPMFYFVLPIIIENVN